MVYLRTTYLVETENFCWKCAKVCLYLEKNFKMWENARKSKVLKSYT